MIPPRGKMALTIDAKPKPREFGWAVRVDIRSLDAEQMNERQALAAALVAVDRELKRWGWDTAGVLEHPWAID